MGAPSVGSLRFNCAEQSRERLLPPKVGGIDCSLVGREVEDVGCFGKFTRLARTSWEAAENMAGRVWAFGKSDPRKIIFSMKQALALVLISLLIFFKEPLEELSQHSVWAIMTVVVIFEFSIGATLSKGFNRGLGTLSAGGLALGAAELSVLAGKYEEFVIILSIFVIGFCTTFVKLYPTMKPYEYGFRVFLLTYCFIMVSGNQSREFIQTAMSRFLLIAVGAAVGLTVNICIYPIWAGEDLHNLVVQNFMGVANSLEGCVNGYLQCVEYKSAPSKILTDQASDDPIYNSYRSAVESKSQEESLQGFAVWEPPHGRFKMIGYPWKEYVKLSGALRHCAFTIVALHGCVLSEIQAPEERRQVFSTELKTVGGEGAKILRELGRKVSLMEKLDPGDFLFEVREAAEHLQKKIDCRSYLLVNSGKWEIGNRPDTENSGESRNMMETETKVLGNKSRSETVLDLQFISFSRNGNVENLDLESQQATGTPENMFHKQVQWSGQHSFRLNKVPREDDCITYESASALSLATFASLMMEFVARLQNLVDSFEELSEKAKFKEPVQEPIVADHRFLSRLRRCFGFKN